MGGGAGSSNVAPDDVEMFERSRPPSSGFFGIIVSLRKAGFKVNATTPANEMRCRDVLVDVLNVVM